MKKRLALLLVAVMGMSSLGQAAYAAEDFGYYGGIISEDTGEQDISELDIITESILPETESEEYGQAGEIPSAAGLVEENPEADVLASDAALQDGLSETDWPDEEIFIAENGEDADGKPIVEWNAISGKVLDESAVAFLLDPATILRVQAENALLAVVNK